MGKLLNGATLVLIIDLVFVPVQSGKTHSQQPRKSASFTNSIMPVKKKLMARVESHLLSDSEEEAILKMISIGKKPNTSGTTRTRSKGRSDEIFALIEKVVAIGAEIRFSNDSDLNLETNTEWFSPKNQKEIRLEVRTFELHFLSMFLKIILIISIPL